MGYFSNNKAVNLNMLRKSGVYSNILLDEMQRCNYEALTELVDEYSRKNVDFMEPILYAIKNEYGTYKVYTYYGENLQDDIELAREIVVEEPELIKDTPISENKQFILELAEINPKVVLHMAQTLKENSNFTEELCELNNKEITMYATKECKMPDTIIENPTLAQNREFMIQAVKEDANILKFTPDEFKNSYDFMKESCSNNKDVINYVAEHSEDFGKEGITAAKEVLVEGTTSRAIDEFKEELHKIQSNKNDTHEKKSGEEVQEIKDQDAENQAIRERQLKNSIKLIERIKNGEVKPERAIRIINILCKDLGEEYKKELLQYIKMDDAIIEKAREENSQENANVELQNIEKTTEGANLEGVKEETKVIRTEIENHIEGRIQINAKEEEEGNGKSDD